MNQVGFRLLMGMVQLVGLAGLVSGQEVKPRGLLTSIASVNSTKAPCILTVNIGGVPLSFDLSAEVRIAMAGRPAQLSDLKMGTRVVLFFAADNRTITAVEAEGRRIGGAILGSSLEGDKHVIRLGPAATFELAKDPEILIDRLPGSVAELADCRTAQVELTADGKAARIWAVWTGGNDIRGKVKSVDPAKNQVTLVRDPKQAQIDGVKLIGKDPVYTLVSDARIYVDGKAVSLDKLPADAEVVLQMLATNMVKAVRAVRRPQPGKN